MRHLALTAAFALSLLGPANAADKTPETVCAALTPEAVGAALGVEITEHDVQTLETGAFCTYTYSLETDGEVTSINQAALQWIKAAQGEGPTTFETYRQMPPFVKIIPLELADEAFWFGGPYGKTANFRFGDDLFSVRVVSDMTDEAFLGFADVAVASQAPSAAKSLIPNNGRQCDPLPCPAPGLK